MRFKFGKNWQSYAQHALTPERLAAARKDFSRLMADVPLQDKRVLDIGFGQGLSISFAAEQGAHAKGIDVDPDNVQAFAMTSQHFELANPPQVVVGSILDPQEVTHLKQAGPFDVVHSWGVLHHTGDMDLAIRNAAGLVAPGGHLVIAIYRSHWSSPLWRAVKWLYNGFPRFLRLPLVWICYAAIYMAKFAATRQNPLRKARGMDFYHDVVDWVGGYPYEHATADEIVADCEALGFELIELIPAEVPTGCNQFVFKRVNG
jgi:2-polyprenyl-6-hydroxyphenyl methylase/3-demethylubiquinone-9 3-methyltransferase